MKIDYRLSFSGGLFAATLLLGITNGHAQGSLTPPPGELTPIFKTLDQVEPRTPIGALPFSITSPGSYYLTKNLTGESGIIISSSNVTLDLMGFELAGGSGDGIQVTTASTNVCVRNGTIRSWSGTGLSASLAVASKADQLTALGNGANGLVLGSTALVLNCTAFQNGQHGISAGDGATLSYCASSSNGTDGISVGANTTVSQCCSGENSGNGISTANGSVLTQCTSSSNGGKGISAGEGGTISNCTSKSNNDDGIFAGIGSSISNCSTYANKGDGIEAESGSQVLHNNCRSNGTNGDGSGIHITGNDSRIDSNNVSMNDRGIDVDASGNLITRNTASGNTANFSITSVNKVGTIINAPSSGAVSGSQGGAGLGSTDPWANFSF